MLIDREAAIDQFRTRAKQHYAEAQSCEDATEETRLGGVYAGLYEAMKIIESLPAIGTCADCAEWAQYHSPLRDTHTASFGEWGGQCFHLHSHTAPSFFCAAWRAKP